MINGMPSFIVRGRDGVVKNNGYEGLEVVVSEGCRRGGML